MTIEGYKPPTSLYINSVDTSYYNAYNGETRPKESLVIKLTPLLKEVRDTYILVEDIKV